MTLHILPPKPTTVQNFKFCSSMICELREFNQKEEEEEERKITCFNLTPLPTM